MPIDMEDLIKKIISKNYSFDKNKDLSLLRKGTDNEVYAYYDLKGNKNIARISKRSISRSIDFEIRLIKILIKKGVTVAPIIKTLDGKDFVEIEGQAVVCFAFVEGEVIKPEELKENLDLVFQAGKALGEFHNATINLPIPSKHRRTIYTEMNRVLKSSAKIKDTFEGGEEFVSDVKNALAIATNKESSWGIIHNDFNNSNVLFENKKLSAIIDFDWACPGPLLIDVGYGAMAWATLDKKAVPNNDIFMNFLKGYSTTGPIKVRLNKIFYFWTAYSCLYLAANVICDSFFDNRYNLSRINQVWMYKRYKYFISL